MIDQKDILYEGGELRLVKGDPSRLVIYERHTDAFGMHYWGPATHNIEMRHPTGVLLLSMVARINELVDEKLTCTFDERDAKPELTREDVY